MARRLDGRARDFGSGPVAQPSAGAFEAEPIAANDNRRAGPNYSSALPRDAVAIIEPVQPAVNRVARPHSGMWRLHFAERQRPRADPLTGWTGGSDPLAQIDLRFPDVEAAERYCRREGVPFELRITGVPSCAGPCDRRTTPAPACLSTLTHSRCRSEHPFAMAAQGVPSEGSSADDIAD